MKNKIYQEIELSKKSVNWGTLKAVSLVLFVIGAAAFLVELYSGDAKRAWSAYLTNYVYWTGLGFGAFLLSPVLVATNAAWGRPVKRIAESVVFFLPLSFILFWPLFFGREQAFWWVLHPEAQKAPWLNTPFFFAREGVAILAMAATAMLLVYYSVKSDLDYMQGAQGAPDTRPAQAKLAVTYIILYAFILSLIAFDLMMSLNPHWVSTLFGAYYFVVSFYCGLALLAILCAFAVRRLHMGGVILKKQFHDIGKLLFAFCVVSMDFFYVQFLVIWYGNIPEETRYVLQRVFLDPWSTLAWTVLFVFFVIPFLFLLIRQIKLNPLVMAAASIWILIAAWLEKFLLVTPSMVKTTTFPLGIFEILITAGWLGIFAFCVLSFLQKYPVLAVSDPKLPAALETEEAKVHLV